MVLYAWNFHMCAKNIQMIHVINMLSFCHTSHCPPLTLLKLAVDLVKSWNWVRECQALYGAETLVSCN
jgi:hypothetical protein